VSVCDGGKAKLCILTHSDISVTMTAESNRPYKYLFMTTNEPDTKSNPNPNPPYY